MNEAPIETEGLEARKRHRIRVILFGVSQSVFAGFLTITALGLENVIKYLIPALSIPLEILNLISQLITFISKKKSLKIILFAILMSVVSLTLLSFTTAVRWGGWSSGILASVAATGPMIFTVLMGSMALINAVNVFHAAKQLYQKPEYRTPLKKFNLINKIVKTGGFALLAAFMIPMSLAAVSNPVGVLIFISLMGATLLTLVTMKIVKTLHENRTWKKTIAEVQDPYQLLGIDKKYLETKLQSNIEKSFMKKLKEIFQYSWYSLFGTADQKEKMEAAQKNTVSTYIQQCFENKVKENATPLVILQNAYDLLSKSRGRLMYEKSQNEVARRRLSVKVSDDEREPLVEAALEAPQYAAIYVGEIGHSHSPAPSSSPDITKQTAVESPRDYAMP